MAALKKVTSLTGNSVAGLVEFVTPRIPQITDRAITALLVIYAVFAPHSIAITQTAYIIALFFWVVQMYAGGKFRAFRTPVDTVLLGFFACCVVSSFLSYAPLISLKGLRSPSLFLAFYVIANKVTTMRFAKLLTLALVGSCMINIAYSAGQIAIGRGVQLDSISPDSPFREISLEAGDIITRANGQRVKRVDDISRAIDSGGDQLLVTYHRKESLYEISLSGETTLTLKGAGPERLGIATSKGRNFRITGFYNHYETYAEVLQLIGALAVGLLIAYPNKRSRAGVFLLGAVLALVAALIMTATRASMVGLATAVVVMSLASFRFRFTVLVCSMIIVVAPIALFIVERSRGISFIDPNEGSTSYRLVVWREALNLVRQHPVVGIGKGSDGVLRERFGLFDNGKLPPGHFHSTPLQIATWWGLPALGCYVAFMTIFLIEGWKLIRRARASNDRQVWGIALGTVGALIAFNVSSLVHWNFGDGEVAMVLWFLSGILVAVRRVFLQARQVREAGAPTEVRPEPSTAVDSAFSATAVQAQRKNTD